VEHKPSHPQAVANVLVGWVDTFHGALSTILGSPYHGVWLEGTRQARHGKQDCAGRPMTPPADALTPVFPAPLGELQPPAGRSGPRDRSAAMAWVCWSREGRFDPAARRAWPRQDLASV
jgi:hypothetical protein